MDIINWFENWYTEQCDGDWEHGFGIKIVSIDNPGWEITIDLTNTDFLLPNEEWKSFEKDSTDWYGFQISQNKFNAAGDPSKLRFLISLFRVRSN